jgi:hypothetical protein
MSKMLLVDAFAIEQLTNFGEGLAGTSQPIVVAFGNVISPETSTLSRQGSPLRARSRFRAGPTNQRTDPDFDDLAQYGISKRANQ